MLSAWLAGAMDFNGSIGIRLGSRQLQPYVIVYSRRKDFLEELRSIWPDFSQPVFVSRNRWMSQIVSIRGTLRFLEKTLPFSHRFGKVGEKVIEFCKSRLTHPNEKYTLGELQMVSDIIRLTSRPSTMKKRLIVLENWR